jgi:HK97 family phage major capsid protein
MAFTPEQLKTFIKEQTLPLIKETMGTDVRDLVQQAVEASLAPLKAAGGTNWAEKLLGSAKPEAPERPKGYAMARIVRATAAAKAGGYGAEKAMDILRAWGDKDIADEYMAAREKALGSGDPTAGGFLVPTTFSTDIIELLRPAAVVRSMGPMSVPMPTGTVKVPKVTTGATASYIGENANISKSQQEFGQITLTWKKLAALVPVSNDLVRYSSPSADAIVRDDIVRALAQREDQAFLRDDGTASTPKGLKHWINAANKFNANATVSLANVSIDLGKALQNLMAANIPLIVATQSGYPNQQGPEPRAGWIFSPRTYRYLTTLQNANGYYVFRDEMLRGTLWGFPFRVSTLVQETLSGGVATAGATQTEIYFGAFAHAVIGEALGIMVDASQEAAYHDGSSVVAAFSQDQTVIRVIAEHDFALRYDRAFTLIEAVTWGA